MLKLSYFLFIFVLWDSFFYIDAKHGKVQPTWSNNLNLEEIEKRMENQEIADLEKLSLGSHEIYIAIMEDGLKAVFKPEKKLHYSYGELAAYKASKWLGSRIVPPTILKKYKDMEGSLQFFVEFPKPGPKEAISQVDRRDLSDVNLFCFVFGKTDRHSGNRLICFSKEKNYIILIDNSSLCYYQHVEYGDFPFVLKSASKFNNLDRLFDFPFNMQKTIEKPNAKNLKKAFGKLVSDERIKKLIKKGKRITYCIWQNLLWIKEIKSEGPSYTDVYCKATLNKYKKLTQQALEEIWSEGLSGNPEYFKNIIELTLNRKNLMLNAAKLGVII